MSGIDKGRCELNNSTLQKAPDEETQDREFTYLVFIEQVCKTICDGYYMYITYQFLVRSEALRYVSSDLPSRSSKAKL